MYSDMKAMRTAETQATQRMRIVADFASWGKRLQPAAHRLERFQWPMQSIGKTPVHKE